MFHINPSIFYAFLNQYNLFFCLAISSNISHLMTLSDDDETRLISWLFKLCEDTVKSIISKLPSCYRFHQEDLLNQARFAVIPPEIFLEDFDFNKLISEDSNHIYLLLRKYTNRKLKFSIFPRLRELTGNKKLGYKPLGLVARASNQEVELSLKSNCTQSQLTQYTFLFKKFKEVKKSEQTPISDWTEVQFNKVAEKYNELKPESFELIDWETVKKILTEIGSKIREYHQNLCSPLTLESYHVTSTLTEEDCYYSENSCGLFKLINTFIIRLNDDSKKLLFLEHGLKLKHKEIAPEFNVGTPAISQRLRVLYKKIITDIWDQYKIPNSERKSENINVIKPSLKETLNKIFETKINDFLGEAKANLATSDIDCQFNKIPIIWLLFRQYNSIAGIIFLRNLYVSPLTNFVTNKIQEKYHIITIIDDVQIYVRNHINN